MRIGELIRQVTQAEPTGDLLNGPHTPCICAICTTAGMLTEPRQLRG